MATRQDTSYFVYNIDNRHYLKIRERANVENAQRKYSWTSQKRLLQEMTYDQARSAANRYGGNIYKRVYLPDGTMEETSL